MNSRLVPQNVQHTWPAHLWLCAHVVCLGNVQSVCLMLRGCAGPHALEMSLSVCSLHCCIAIWPATMIDLSLRRRLCSAAWRDSAQGTPESDTCHATGTGEAGGQRCRGPRIWWDGHGLGHGGMGRPTSKHNVNLQLWQHVWRVRVHRTQCSPEARHYSTGQPRRG
jgi:hypothetical protein